MKLLSMSMFLSLSCSHFSPFLSLSVQNMFCSCLNVSFFPLFELKQLNMIFGMAAMPFLCNGTLLFQGNLPRVLPVIIKKYASVLSPMFICSYFCVGNGLGSAREPSIYIY